MTPTPNSPIRDNQALGPTEDLDRQPDGIPHRVVGLTAVLAITLALAVIGVVTSRGAAGQIFALLGAAIALLALVGIVRHTEHDRDHVHPSR